MRLATVAVGIVAFGLAGGGARGADTPLGDASEPVPLYTNADLERFRTPSLPLPPVKSSIPEDRGFVEAFLDREYARIDADRDRQLRWYEAELAAVPPRPHWVAPYLGVYGGGYPYPFRYPGSLQRPTQRPEREGRLDRGGGPGRASDRGFEPRGGGSRHPLRGGSPHGRR